MKELNIPDGNFLAAQWHALFGVVTRKESRGFLTTGPDQTRNTGGQRFLVTAPNPKQHEDPRHVSLAKDQTEAKPRADSLREMSTGITLDSSSYPTDEEINEKDEWLESKHLRFRQLVDPRSFAYREPRLKRGKRLFVEPVTTDNGRATKIKTVSSTEIYAGGLDTKMHIEATLGSHRVSLFRRTYSKKNIKTWKAFREAGLPVFPTMRRTILGSEPFLLVTDVKADGSEVYGKGLDIVLGSPRLTRERPPSPEVDKHFLAITSPENIHVVEERARELTARATEHGLRLPKDDAFELHVRPDGTWDLIILDLEEGGIFSEMPPDLFAEDNLPLEQKNEKATNSFLNRSIRNVRKHLQLAA